MKLNPVSVCAADHSVNRLQSHPETQEFVFVLLGDFSTLSQSSAIETLRIANRAAGKLLYRWRLLSEDGQAVRSSQALQTFVAGPLEDIDRNATIIVCGGLDIERHSSPKIRNWLQEQAAKGLCIGGLCTASYTLAQAGLLNGKRATIHWENRAIFAKTFPDVILSDAVFEIDGGFLSTAGGISSIDLFLRLIADHGGEALSELTAERMLHASNRELQSVAKVSGANRRALRNPTLLKATSLIEESVENPPSSSDLSQCVDLSVRQLERLFRKHLNVSPGRYILGVRLDRSHQLLVQTGMSISEVALACGFGSTQSFSKCYRRRFGRSPHNFRGRRQGLPLHPSAVA